MYYKNKKVSLNKRAFTLIELLIVIAIIGILFIVLISKVDFATDKAKATGVQTDFRSFQMAFDTVAKENAGFNTFGWDTGDANQDGIRNSYDKGDNGDGGGTAKNGIQDGDEVFTGHKVYDETFTKVFSLKKNGTGSYDRDALNRLETAINANLDPKLHITIKDDGEIVMANGAQDPWNKEYHGWYITNAETDGKDRGAIVMYSDGANNEFGSEHTIANGVVSISIPGNNKDGKDDYSIVSLYTYVNGYGEVKNITTGFSNNQSFLAGNATNNGSVVEDDNQTEGVIAKASLNDYTWSEIKTIAQMNLDSTTLLSEYNINLGDTKTENGYTYRLVDLDGNDYDGFVFMYDTQIQSFYNYSIISTDPNHPLYEVSWGAAIEPCTVGGYKDSILAVEINELWENLDSNELKNVIKEVQIQYNDDQLNNYAPGTYTTHLFAVSCTEINSIKNYMSDEGVVFDYFVNDAVSARMSICSMQWATRSCNINFGGYEIVRTDGTANGGIGSPTKAQVVAAFVVG